MVHFQVLLLGAAAIQSAYGFAIDEDWPVKLLKRQQPGTPLYNCHDNCGQAIVASRKADACKIEVFTTNYKNCLSCAGPDNYNIWNYYRGTLSAAASKCSLSTTPLSGKQPDPPTAIPAGGSGEHPGGPPSSTPPRDTTPSTPSETEQPETPSKTEEPETPSKSEQPETPSEAPSKPEESEVPSHSASPDTPHQTSSGPDATAPPAEATASTSAAPPPAFTGGANILSSGFLSTVAAAALAMLMAF